MIATDGPATNDSLSLLDSLRVTALLTNLNSCELLDMIKTREVSESTNQIWYQKRSLIRS